MPNRWVSTAALALLITHCGSEGDVGRAQVGLTVGSALQANSIARVTLTINPGMGAPLFPPIVSMLTNQDADGGLGWTGSVEGIPAGPLRIFEVDAFDAATPPNLLYSGTALSDVAAGSLTTVSMVLQQADPSYTAPTVVIDSLTASGDAVDAGESIQFAVAAHDSEPGVTLSYQWTASCGLVANATSATAMWTAPAGASDGGSCQVTITVTDSAGSSVSANLSVAVQ